MSFFFRCRGPLLICCGVANVCRPLVCSKDVRLPVQLQRAMAAEAEAAREARAKVIAAEGEQRASRALKEAADVINESPAALQVSVGSPPKHTRTHQHYYCKSNLQSFQQYPSLLVTFTLVSDKIHPTFLNPRGVLKADLTAFQLQARIVKFQISIETYTTFTY